jgi:hypothetical protein
MWLLGVIPHVEDSAFSEAHFILLGESLVGNTHLKTLEFNEFHKVSGAPGLTDQAMDALTNGFRHCQLKKIYLGSDSSLNFQKRIFEAIRHAKTVEELVLSHKTIDSYSVANLFLAQARMFAADTSVMNVSHGIVEFHLTSCNVSARQMRILSPGLHCIQKLSLEDCRLTDSAIDSLVQFWSPTSRIETLSLENNQIGPRGARRLMRAAASHRILAKLNLSKNKKIGYGGLQMIGEELGRVSLVELDIVECVGLNTANRSSACVALAEGLRKNASIERMRWQYGNELGPEGVQMMLRATASRSIPMNFDCTIKSWDELQFIGKELSHARLKQLRLYFVSSLEPMTLRDELLLAFVNGLHLTHSIQKLSMDNFSLTREQTQFLFTALSDHPTMEFLDVDGKDTFGYQGLEIVGNLVASSRLLLISFSSNNAQCDTAITSPIAARIQACQVLANGLRNNSTIQILRLGYNVDMDWDRTQLLLAASANHPSLWELSLDLNFGLGKGEIIAIAQHIPNLRLKELCVMDHYFVRTRIPSKETEEAGLVLAESIKNNFHLCELEIPAVYMNRQAQFFLDLNSFGRLQLLARPGLAPELCCYVLSKLTAKASHMFYFLKEQPWLMTVQ